MIAVAIDGPAGAGKSTISRRAAQEMGFIYVDTGALYRAIGLYALQNQINIEDSKAVEKMLSNIKVELVFAQGEQHVMLCGQDVTSQIRTPAVSMAASQVSAVPFVRSFLFDLQQKIAVSHNVVMDGRDIGTVVLPNAQVKIFLTASPEERATRRYNEMLEKGENAEYDKVLADIRQRDYNDSHRAVAPLMPAKDAILVDTTGNTLEQSVKQLINIIKERLP